MALADSLSQLGQMCSIAEFLWFVNWHYARIPARQPAASLASQGHL